MENQITVIGTRGNIEKGQLIRSLVIIAARYFDGISRISKRDKFDSLDNTSVCNVKTGNDTLGKAHRHLWISLKTAKFVNLRYAD
jgi:hypothetical protein